MGEWNPFRISKMDKEILDIFLKYGFGDMKMYQSSYFTCQLSDETACLTLEDLMKDVSLNKRRENGR